MDGLVRIVVVLAVVGTIQPVFSATSGPSRHQDLLKTRKIPSPSKSRWDPCIMLLPGGTDTYTISAIGPAADTPFQPWDTVVRDPANLPILAATVTLDFSACSDLSLSDLNEGASPLVGRANSIHVDCTTKFLTAECADGTDGPAGALQLVVRGAGRNSLVDGGVGPGGFGQVAYYADGQLMGYLTAVVPDENGAGTAGTVSNCIDASDGSFFRFDLFNYSATAGRSDFNCSGQVDAPDGSVVRDFLFNDIASQGILATTYCVP